MRIHPPTLLLAALGWVAAMASGTAPAQAQLLPPMAAITADQRVLIIAPHPDDETLCCAGLIQSAIEAGAGVAVVWLTAGDAFELDAALVEHAPLPDSGAMIRLGRQRLREAHAAADTLGVARERQFVLGYPDRGITALLGGDASRPYRSPYTACDRVPYREAVSPNAPYTSESLERDLELVIERFRPTLVMAAAPEDLHPDHRASGSLARRILERRGQVDALRYWIVHARNWPRPYGLNPQRALLPPAAAAARPWRALLLDSHEREGKLAALRRHGSQMRIMAPLLEAFVRADEIFAQEDATGSMPPVRR